MTFLLLLIPSTVSILYASSETYVIELKINIDFIPNRILVCAPEEVQEDARWAASKWNEALETFSNVFRELKGIYIEVVKDGCFANINFSERAIKSPELGGFNLAFDKETFRLKGANISIASSIVDNRALLRSVLLHEFGHLLGASDLTPLGNGKERYLMLYRMDETRPILDITFADVYLVWLSRVKRVECDISCPAYALRIPNYTLENLAASIIVPAVLASIVTTAVNHRSIGYSLGRR